MLFYIVSLILATSVLIVAVLIFVSEDLSAFKNKYASRTFELPILSPNGQILNTVDDLEEELSYLKEKLDEKQNEIEKSKLKVCTASDSLKKLGETSDEVKKYYIKLKNDIMRSEKECLDLQDQIQLYKEKQKKLRQEVKDNVKYYSNILSNIDLKSIEMQDYEIVQ
ncbi:unnamed protein product [Brassicogethes aeneus]|uniref:Uncharacterized protein n=1 Tax=Brassicogethes aeneus TaxID=1431903 RepID=A0A9P0BKK6_BRAAE|nr:unnamed protein product [Brassicogethes aeneus]